MTSLLSRIVAACARGVLLVGAITAAPALAQAPARPRNVNDCTFLQDPIAVRDCIESFQGSVQAPDAEPPSPNLPTLTPPAAPIPPPPTQPPQQAPPPRLAPR
jgi:hypothetical protein